MTTLKATAALSNLFNENNVDPDRVTIIICADNVMLRSKIERAIARELNALSFTPLGPAVSEEPDVRAFKLHGVRVVVSDLTHEEPMYLITKDAPR